MYSLASILDGHLLSTALQATNTRTAVSGVPRAMQWAQSCTAWVFVARSFAGAYLGALAMRSSVLDSIENVT